MMIKDNSLSAVTNLNSNYVFSEVEKESLFDLLSEIKENPYFNKYNFLQSIKNLAESVKTPKFFKELCKHAKQRNNTTEPFFYLKNIPNDKDRPIFDFDNPVTSKRNIKKSFIAEAFLALFTTLTDSELITYKNDNNGDFFHDVYPMKQLSDTQSQKSLVSLGFHNDSSNHFARPEWLNMLCMRNSSLNTVYTTFVKSIDIISNLSDHTLNVLKQPQFDTPYDVLTKFGDEDAELDTTKKHSIINDDHNLIYFENRTTALNEEGEEAMKILNAVIHKNKYSLQLEPDDLISINNNKALHSREIVSIKDPEAHKTRWSIKTYSVPSLDKYKHLFIEGEYGVING